MCSENCSHDGGRDSRQPQRPSTAYLDAMSDLIDARVSAVEQSHTDQELRLDAYPQQQALWKAVDEQVENLEKDLGFIIEDLHAHPSLAFEEVRSQKVQIGRASCRERGEISVVGDVVEREGRDRW